MRKSYYLLYGSTLSQKELISFFEDKISAEFVERESYYFGIYFSYIGLYCDQLNIYKNLMPNRDLHIKDTKVKTALSFSFHKGKNSDKKSRYTYIKSHLNKLEDFILFKDKIIEE